MSYVTCQRCDRNIGQAVTITGGVCAKLCASCRTDLNEYLLDHRLWSDLTVNGYRLAQVTNNPSRDSEEGDELLQSLVHNKIELEKQVFRLVRRWLCEHSK
jgi:hypothetical protein